MIVPFLISIFFLILNLFLQTFKWIRNFFMRIGKDVLLMNIPNFFKINPPERPPKPMLHPVGDERNRVDVYMELCNKRHYTNPIRWWWYFALINSLRQHSSPSSYLSMVNHGCSILCVVIFGQRTVTLCQSQAYRVKKLIPTYHLYKHCQCFWLNNHPPCMVIPILNIRQYECYIG